MAVTLLQVEKFTLQMGASDTSKNHTLVTTLTDTSKAFLVFGIRNSQNQPAYSQVSGKIASTTTVTFQRDTASGVVDIVGYVAEFSAGVVVERGTANESGEPTTIDITLSSITDLSKAFVLFSVRCGGSTHSADDAVQSYLWDDSGTKKLRLQVSGTKFFGITHYVEWQVIQYDDCSVQRGSDTGMASGDSSELASISEIDLSKSFLIFSYIHPDGTSANIGQKLLRGRITSSTQLTFDRDQTGVEISDIRWEVVSFTGNESVQEVLESFVATDGQEDATITSVDTDKALALASAIQKGGKGNYSSDDIPGEAWFTAEITSSTNLQTKRASTNSTADACFYVINFEGAGLVEFASNIQAQSSTVATDLAVSRDLSGTISAASSSAAISLAIVRELSGAIAAGTFAADVTLTIVRSLASSVAAGTLTPAAAMNVVRAISSSVSAGSMSSDILITVARNLSSSLPATSATSDIIVAIARKLTSTVAAESLTSDATLSLLLAFQSSIAAETVTPTAALAVTRALSSSPAATSSTGDILASITRELSSSIAAETATSSITLTLENLIEFASSIEAASNASDITLAISRTLTSSLSAQTATSNITLTCLMSFASSISGATSTSEVLLAISRAFASSLQGVSLSSDAGLAISRALTSNLLASSVISDISLEKLLSFISSIAAQSSTPDVTLSVQRLLSSAVTGQSHTLAVTLAVIRELVSQLQAESSSSEIILMLAVLGIILDPSIESATAIRTFLSQTKVREFVSITPDRTIEAK